MMMQRTGPIQLVRFDGKSINRRERICSSAYVFAIVIIIIRVSCYILFDSVFFLIHHQSFLSIIAIATIAVCSTAVRYGPLNQTHNTQYDYDSFEFRRRRRR